MAHKKDLSIREDFYRQLDEMLAMPGMGAPAGQQSSLLGRIRQTVKKTFVPKIPRR